MNVEFIIAILSPIIAIAPALSLSVAMLFSKVQFTMERLGFPPPRAPPDQSSLTCPLRNIILVSVIPGLSIANIVQ